MKHHVTINEPDYHRFNQILWDTGMDSSELIHELLNLYESLLVI